LVFGFWKKKVLKEVNIMEKPASTNHSINELIQRRWSPQAFSDETVEPDVLCRLFEAARWAPSCYNDQPWSYIVGRKGIEDSTYQDLLSCLVEGNQKWAKNAPVLALSVARRQFTHNGEENRHSLHDVGLSVENLVIQALDEGLFVHQMAGYDQEEARDAFSIPEDHVPVAVMAIGYPGDPETLPEDLAEAERAERSRKPFSEMIYSNKWGQSSDIV
jgi:nitroreductase